MNKLFEEIYQESQRRMSETRKPLEITSDMVDSLKAGFKRDEMYMAERSQFEVKLNELVTNFNNSSSVFEIYLKRMTEVMLI